MRSIERLLLVWVLGALTVGAAALVGVSYLLTLQELGEVFDENLKQVALATAYHQSTGTAADAESIAADQSAVRAGNLGTLPKYYDSEGDFDFITVVWRADGTRLFSSDPSVPIPFTKKTGLQHLSMPDGRWHVFSIVEPNLVVQAAQRESSRNVLAAEVASKMFVPLAALVVLIGVLTVIALRRGLRSLDLAAASVAQRTADTLRPVSLIRMPREIHPLVLAINDLLARLAVAFTTQKRFVADAAHELRTPVTALRLQLQLLERAQDGPARDEAISNLKAGIARSQHLIEQLLHLSRFEPDANGASAGAATPFGSSAASGSRAAHTDLAALARDVVASMSIKADHRGIDLGAETQDAVVVRGEHEQLLVLLNNLVENALRFTPRSGVIDVRATMLNDRPMLQVIDSGPGIHDTERERVFDRFYRGEAPDGELRPDQGQSTGSGLGLAIVKAIADRHKADVSLHTAPNGRGLEVRVLF